MNAPMPPATRLAQASFFLLGWTAVLVPTLILSVEHQFGASDTVVGVLYLINAACYVAGSLGGGPIVERAGRRFVFPIACLLAGGGLVSQGVASAWAVFVLGSAVQGLGGGAIAVCANSLIIDSFPDARGKALSELHLFWALGALTAPVALSWLVRSGVAWQGLMLCTGLGGCLLAALLVPLHMTSGRRAMVGRAAAPQEPTGGSVSDTAVHRVVPGESSPPLGSRSADSRRLQLPTVIAVLVVAAACYVASESAITGWVVRYLSPVRSELAPFALTLFWAGLAAGRIVAARIAHRLSLVSLVVSCTLAGAIGLVIAVLVPASPGTVALFAVVGLAYGPIYPSIMTLASERYPERSASVSGVIGTAGVAGQSVYPPIMGFVSPTLGLGAGMLGAAALLVLSGIVTARTRRTPLDHAVPPLLAS